MCRRNIKDREERNVQRTESNQDGVDNDQGQGKKLFSNRIEDKKKKGKGLEGEYTQKDFCWVEGGEQRRTERKFKYNKWRVDGKDIKKERKERKIL